MLKHGPLARMVLVAYEKHDCIACAVTIEYDPADYREESQQLCFRQRLLYPWSRRECGTQATYNRTQDDKQTPLDEPHHPPSA